MNNNIEEKLVSIQVAKLLKEAGFDVPCHTFVVTEESEYGELDEVITDPDGTYPSLQYNSLYDTLTALPTQQLAIDWIRANFGVHIADHFNEYDEKYQYVIWVFELNQTNSSKDVIDNGKQFNTPEEAIEAALENVLTNLIN